MIVRGATARAKAVDLLPLQVDFAAGETVGPERIEGEAMTQEFDGTRLVRAAEVDDTTAWPALQIERPVRREGTTVGRWCSGLSRRSRRVE